MDAEHRHELRDNDLIKWIMQTPKFVSEYYMQIIGVCCIIVAVLLYGPVRDMSKKGRLKEHMTLTNNIMSLDQSKIEALQAAGKGEDVVSTMKQKSEALTVNGGDMKSDQAGAIAFIKSAEACRIDLHYTTGEIEREVIEANISKAKGLYGNALSRAKGNATLTAMAKFGLGLCEEELGNYDEASNIYTEISSDEGLAGTVYSVAAAKRLEDIGEYQQKVVFVDRPVVEIEPEVPDVLETVENVVEDAVSGAGDTAAAADKAAGEAEKVQE